MTTSRLEHCLDQWYSDINHALNIACPEKSVRVKDVNNPWWTKELQQQQRKILRAHFRAKLKTPTEENKNVYRRNFNQFRKDCNNAKQKNWRQFVENTNDKDGMNVLRKILEKNKRNTLGILQRQDGTLTNPGKETLEYLLQSHYPSLEPIQDTNHTDTKIQTSLINSACIPGINTEALETVFNGFKNKKSPGPDKLRPLILKELPRNKLEELIFIYKTMLLLKFTPTKWKNTKVIWIPKAWKDSYKAFKSWRGISLSNDPLKGLEKLIAKQADKDMVKVHAQQHGFSRNRSTESAISQTTNYIEKHITTNRDVIGVFLDIQAAFDTITPNSIREALLEHNLNPILVEWYYNYLTHRIGYFSNKKLH